MKLTKEERAILKQDVADLDMLIKKYIKEKKFEKASECLKEMEKIQKRLKGDLYEKES